MNKWSKQSKSWDEIAQEHSLENFMTYHGDKIDIMPRIGCLICGRFTKYTHVGQKPKHYFGCHWKRFKLYLFGE